VKQKVELQSELVPLPEATAVAWHVITERAEPLRAPQELAQTRALVAIALASVVPVLKQREGGAPVPLSMREVNERLFVRGSAPILDDLYIRRGDLVHAIEVLKEAHIAFDRKRVIDWMGPLA
jgi:hypothetical protein